MRSPFLRLLCLPFVAAVALAACTGDTIPSGLAATPPGSGPGIVFNLTAQPLPTIPLPNDVATFADPTSRTGLRINASLLAPTHIETVARQGFDDMEGWGTYQAITVGFTPESSATAGQPAIDLGNVESRMQGDDYDFSNDPIYLIKLATGLPVPLDVGDGNFPATVADPTAYFPNDVKLYVVNGQPQPSNLLVETVEEGAGLTQANYTPALDLDFDGVLDHPDTYGAGKQWPGVDNLTAWYEQQTDTLRVRPVLPLEEKTTYAVILTDRLTGPDGQPVRSPFPYIYHPSQAGSAGLVAQAINQHALAGYFGDIAGSGLQHVAFMWTFTTAPIQEDMRLLRDGLYGRGPFARFQGQFPPQPTLFQAAGPTADATLTAPSGWQSTPACTSVAGHPYTVFLSNFLGDLDLFYAQFGYSGTVLSLLEQEATNIDHIVVGTFPSPWLMGDPSSTDPDTQFHLNFVTGAGDVTEDQVHFYITVPKTDPKKGFSQPFPVSFWGHGVTGADDEVFIEAGHFAKQGIAMIAFDAPEHGRTFDPTTLEEATALLEGSCLGPLVNGIDSGRAYDLNGDGVPDSGGLFWTAHLFHTRDNVRQAILDSMQATRMLRTFDGTTMATQDYNNDGLINDLAGDFDGDGTPDLGGPHVNIFASGESLGGILSEIQGGIDPNISASGPVSGGGGGAYDIALRSYGIADSVMLETIGPLIMALPVGDPNISTDQNGKPQTQCTGQQRSLRWYVNDLTASAQVEIACLDPSELGPGMTVVVTNITSGEVRCSRTWSALPNGTPDLNGRFRIAIPASVGDAIDVQVYNMPDVVDSYATCNVPTSVAPGRRVNTWEQAAVSFGPVGDPSDVCPADAMSGCQQFNATFYEVGDPLVAPQEGYGLSRQTPQLRQLMDLAQTAFDPADPINFAPYYTMRPLLDVSGNPLPPRALLSVNTAGDGFVNIASGIAFGRAAGAVPLFTPSAVTTFPDYADYATPEALFQQWGRTANDLLIGDYEVEGVASLMRAPAGPSCGVNYAMSMMCSTPPPKSATACADALFDADWIDEGQENYAQQHPMTPLRPARDATLHATDAASLAAVWAPRLTGTPFTPDTAAWKNPVVAMMTTYFQLTGQHSFDAGDPCDSFDASTYLNGTLARFFASNGTDVYYISHPTTHRCLANQSCPFED
jgi:hypothetical protein